SDGPAGIPPLLSRLEWPETWSVLVALPSTGDGLHGPEEARAFDELPPMTAAQLDRVGRLVLLELLPALAERDLDGFGAALEELQHHVGAAFAPAQGGLYGDAQGERLAAVMRQVGLRGVGQSSWGPTVFAIVGDEETARHYVRRWQAEAPVLIARIAPGHRVIHDAGEPQS
ncbi:MAG: GHMP kinase, partial [Candidatus Bipolaricaulota bacterium]|nr:GHMP kinase [Candidatus Bipolaricaulota bacterium]